MTSARGGGKGPSNRGGAFSQSRRRKSALFHFPSLDDQLAPTTAARKFVVPSILVGSSSPWVAMADGLLLPASFPIRRRSNVLPGGACVGRGLGLPARSHSVVVGVHTRRTERRERDSEEAPPAGRLRRSAPPLALPLWALCQMGRSLGLSGGAWLGAVVALFPAAMVEPDGGKRRGAERNGTERKEAKRTAPKAAPPARHGPRPRPDSVTWDLGDSRLYWCRRSVPMSWRIRRRLLFVDRAGRESFWVPRVGFPRGPVQSMSWSHSVLRDPRDVTSFGAPPRLDRKALLPRIASRDLGRWGSFRAPEAGSQNDRTRAAGVRFRSDGSWRRKVISGAPGRIPK